MKADPIYTHAAALKKELQRDGANPNGDPHIEWLDWLIKTYGPSAESRMEDLEKRVALLELKKAT